MNFANFLKYDTFNARAIAEDELITLGGTVLNLSGLWGGERQPKHWLDRVADTKEKLASKQSLHMVHGLDVGRSIIAVHDRFPKAAGQRWVRLKTCQIQLPVDLLLRITDAYRSYGL
jgi:hypothetical protein